MKASAIAQKATDLVGGDRKAAYGDVVDGLEKIATMMNAVLTIAGKSPAIPIEARDVAMLMVAMKTARVYTGPFRADSFVDIAGWAAVAGEAASRGPRG
jgi:hypothetical protein